MEKMKIKCHHFADFNQDIVIEMTNNSQFISIIRFYSRKEGMLGENEYHIRMSSLPLLDETLTASDSYSLVKTKIWFRLHRILNISYISLNDIIKEVKTSNFIIGKQIPKKEDVLLYKKSNCMFFLKVISIEGNNIHYQRITISDPCYEYVLNNDIVNLYSNIEYAFTESYKITNGDYIWANLSSVVGKISKIIIYYFSYGCRDW